MNVKELIEELEMFDQDMEVKFKFQSGDFWKTELASEIVQISEGYVEHSDYHDCDKVIDYNSKVSTLVLLIS